MRANLKSRFATLILISFVTLIFSPKLKAQDEKFKPRLSVDYNKVMGQNGFLLINVKFKGEDGYEPAVGLKLNVYQQITEDSLAFVGSVETNHKGNAEYYIEHTLKDVTDTILEYEYVVKIEKSDKFKKAKKAAKYRDAFLIAKTIEEDSVQYISAQLLDAKGEPIEGEDLAVKVRRLFAPLTIGESSYETDEDGRIMVAIENPIPSKDGNLTFEVSLDAKKYGIVKAVFDSPIGVEMEDLSTYDQRTMWSPPGKTPIFLLVFANMIIFGIWIVIFILIRNLIRIRKS